MNSGQVEPYLAHDSFSDQVISEWVKIFGILLGIGLMPLLFSMAEIPARLDWISHQLWLPSLVAGLLVILAGVVYGLRQVNFIRRRLAEANPPLVLDEGKLPPRNISIQTDSFASHSINSEINLLLVYLRLGRAYLQVVNITSLGWLENALVQPWMKIPPQVLDRILSQGTDKLQVVTRPKLAEFLREIALESQGLYKGEERNPLAEFNNALSGLSNKLQDPSWQAAEALTWMIERLDYSRLLETTYGPGKIFEQKIEALYVFIEHIRADRIPAQALPEWVDVNEQVLTLSDQPSASSEAASLGDGAEATYTYLHTPTFMIAVGALILLPAMVVFLMQQNKVENPDLIQWYFSSPAIFLWMAVESVYFYQSWQAAPQQGWEVLGLLKSVLQIAGALVLWCFLGSFFGLKGDGGLFWLATGLAAAGAISGNLGVWLQAQINPKQQSNDASSSPTSDSNHSMAAARFQVFSGKRDKYFFHLLDEQEKTLIKSEGYATLASCLIDILSLRLLMQNDASPDQHFERFATAKHKRKGYSGRHQRPQLKYYFILKDSQRMIGMSESFASEDDLQRDIQNVQELAPKAIIHYLP